MDYRTIVNWLVSPLPPVFETDTKGNKLAYEPNSLSSGLSKFILFVKVTIVLVILVFAYRIVKLFKN